MRQVRGRDADALIANGDRGPAIVDAHFEPHTTPVRTVLDGVAEQIVHDPLQTRAIEHADHFVRLALEDQLVPTHILLVLFDGVPRELHQVSRLQPQTQILGSGYGRNLEQLIDPAGHARRRALDAVDARPHRRVGSAA